MKVISTTGHQICFIWVNGPQRIVFEIANFKKVDESMDNSNANVTSLIDKQKNVLQENNKDKEDKLIVIIENVREIKRVI